MPQDKVAANIQELIATMIHLVPKGLGVEDLSGNEQYKRMQTLFDEVVEDLMWHPGRLIYFQDSKMMELGQSLVNFLWDGTDAGELWDELHSGGFSGLLVNLTGDYCDRAVQLKPTFIAVEPTQEVRQYFQEAMLAWVHGLDRASLILCWSVIENLLREKLSRQDTKLVYEAGSGKSLGGLKEKSCHEWIRSARRLGWLDDVAVRQADAIKKARREAVHRQSSPLSKEVYQFIMDTKNILEQLMKVRVGSKK